MSQSVQTPKDLAVTDIPRTFRAVNSQMAKHCHPFQENESILVLDQLLNASEDFDNHLRRASISLLMSIIYGMPPLKDSKNPVILRVNRFTERALAAAAPGAFLVEYFTWMEHLPRWMSSWRRYAEDWFARDSAMFEKLYSDVEDRLVSQFSMKLCAVAHKHPNSERGTRRIALRLL